MPDISALPGFYRIAQADPDRRAVIDTDGAVTTYGELLARVNQVSHGLRARGLAEGDVVAGVLPNGLDAVVMLMATGQVGLYYVPVNWHLTDTEIAYILADCDAEIVVAGPARPVEGALTGTADLAEGQPVTAPEGRSAGAVMWYTSGTTGFPKGVQRPLPGTEPEATVPLVTWFLGEVCDLRPGDGIHLVTSPMYHSAPCAHTMFALHLGHTLVIAPRFEPAGILELIDRYRVTNAMMVPTMFHRMLRLPAEVRRAYDVSSLRQVVHTAAACPVAVKKQIMDWWGPVLYEYYGSTESTIAFSVKPHDWLERPGTVGRPAPGFEARILGPEGEELPVGEPGMVYVKSGLGGFAYRKDPAKTAASMRGEWYAPGDIGFMDKDGFLFLCDRRTDLIVSGGVNIYPAEIEAALLEHPGVADVAVIGVPDEEWGHTVVALVQPAPGAPPSPQELLEHLGPRIARFKHPRVIEFREELPRTPTGKLSRTRVREEYLSR
ncbi:MULTISPECIES: AMP-binding protein [Streptosporangium]|uniref:Long-chain acyl-CoA synthetase n=1 Tax=Streptosporangium brasiliense TaxID=47480 RepID=A0ABT9RCN9_9ACTN|nr:AMP-binding protein [Streptosporangium brasiliense]MDP9866539.1 long-chain acyl-CoA synthetase [Streptosporangium brasiliense]